MGAGVAAAPAARGPRAWEVSPLGKEEERRLEARRGELEAVFTARGERELRGLAAGLAELLHPGDVVLLTGELGAGKTCFIQGMAEGLGVKERVLSPTFTLLREYRGRLSLYHLDAYRLEGPWDLYQLGLEDYLEGEGVVAVEWADRVRGFFGEDCLEVFLDFAEGGEARTVTLRSRGGDWGERLSHLRGVG